MHIIYQRAIILGKQNGGHCSGTIAHWLHCSAFDFRWPALTMRYIGKNHQFLDIYPEISPDRYFSMKYRVDTLWYTIATFSFLVTTDGMNFNEPRKLGFNHIRKYIINKNQFFKIKIELAIRVGNTLSESKMRGPHMIYHIW